MINVEAQKSSKSSALGYKLDNLDKVMGVIIRLRSNENAECSKNQLIAMLEELLKKDEISRKKEKLSNKYGLIMNDHTERRLGDMCNLSDLLVQESTAKGKAEGRAEGENRLNQLYLLLMEDNRLDDLQKATKDENYRAVLYAEFHL